MKNDGSHFAGNQITAYFAVMDNFTKLSRIAKFGCTNGFLGVVAISRVRNPHCDINPTRAFNNA